MRKELKKYFGQRITITATFKRYGTKTGYMGLIKTILLIDVKKDDEYLTDHIWFACGKTFEDLELSEGDQVRFDARVTRYTKGYKGWRFDAPPPTVDYRFERPTKAQKLNSSNIKSNINTSYSKTC